MKNLKKWVLITGILTFIVLLGCAIYTKTAFDIIKCQSAEVVDYQTNPDYNGKEGPRWHRIELSNGAKYQVNIENNDTTYDFQFSDNGIHYSEFLYENQLRNLFKQNLDFYQKLINSIKIFTHQIRRTIYEEKVEKEIREKSKEIREKKCLD